MTYDTRRYNKPVQRPPFRTPPTEPVAAQTWRPRITRDEIRAERMAAWIEWERWRAQLIRDARAAGAYDMIDMAPERR